MSPTAVAITCIALFLAIVAWDVWLFFDDRQGNTITAQARKLPRFIVLMIVYALGLVVGHLWW